MFYLYFVLLRDINVVGLWHCPNLDTNDIYKIVGELLYTGTIHR